MKTIEIFDDNYSVNRVYERIRYAARAVILDGDRIFIERARTQPIIMLPGGGIEFGESKEDCVVRECSEECGLIVNPLKQLFVIKEYFNDIIFHTGYLLCEIIGNCQCNPTVSEKELSLTSFYQDINVVCGELKGILDSIEDKESELYGMNYREYLATKEILNIVQSKI